jgi:Domain of unknown function (DUF1851)
VYRPISISYDHLVGLVGGGAVSESRADVPLKPTWADLLIDDSSLDFSRLLRDWRWLLVGSFRVVVGSKFGDWFVERPGGAVEMLDMRSGKLNQVAASRGEFYELIRTREKQEEWLLSDLVMRLKEKGIVLGPGQCYAFSVPPIFGGTVDPDSVEVMDLAVWVSFCGQIQEQVRNLPPETPIETAIATETEPESEAGMDATDETDSAE